MSFLRTWGIGIASACVVGGIVSFLKPKKGVGRVMSLMLGAFFIAVIISPFLGKNKLKLSNDLRDVTYNTLNYDSFDDYMVSQQLSAAADAVKKQIAALLNKNKIEYGDINVSMNIGEDNSIVIKELSVTLENRENMNKVYSIIKKELGLEASVKIK